MQLKQTIDRIERNCQEEGFKGATDYFKVIKNALLVMELFGHEKCCTTCKYVDKKSNEIPCQDCHDSLYENWIGISESSQLSLID